MQDKILNFINENVLQDNNSYIIPGIGVAMFTYFVLPNNQIRNVILISLIHSSLHMIVNKLKKKRNDAFVNVFLDTSLDLCSKKLIG